MTDRAQQNQRVRGGWVNVGPGWWQRRTTRHRLEITFSPEGFDWTIRDAVTDELLMSEIESTADRAKYYAMQSARSIGQPLRGRSAP